MIKNKIYILLIFVLLSYCFSSFLPIASLSKDNINTINVKNYGAIGNGYHDDKNAFLKAMKDAVLYQKTLYIPNGTYNLNALNYTAIKSLVIKGQDKNKTVLQNIGNLIVNENIYLEDISLLNTVSDTTIKILPKSFSSVSLKNIKSDNNKKGVNVATFLSCIDPNSNKGISNISVDNCEFAHNTSKVFLLRCSIRRGNISNNLFSEIGFDDNKDVSVILAGYQDKNNITTARAENLTINQNTFINIYSAQGIVHETTEAHAILVYGTRVNILDNTVKNIFGGGKNVSDLDSGFDHEAIYLKASNSLIKGNYVENGCGQTADGAITLKGQSSNCQVESNTITGYYGTGIFADSPSISITQNLINLSNGICGVFSGGLNAIIEGNIIEIRGESNKWAIYANNPIHQKKSISNNQVKCDSGIGINLNCYGTLKNNTVTTSGSCGINVYNSSIVNVFENTVTMTGKPISGSCCLTVSCIKGKGNIYIRDNTLKNLKNKSPEGQSQCLKLSSAANTFITGNKMYSSADRVIYYMGVQQEGKSYIINNELSGINASILFLYSNTRGCNHTLQKNKIHFTSDANKDTKSLLEIEDMDCTIKMDENQFKIESVILDVLHINSCKKYEIDRNNFLLSPPQGSNIPSLIFINNNRNRNTFNKITRNEINGSPCLNNFLTYRIGDEAGNIIYNIGTVLIQNNSVILSGGHLVETINKKHISTNSLSVTNNIINSDEKNSIISYDSKPTSNYHYSGNIEQ